MSNLWSGMRIPILMVSGPVNSGKTLFALTIDPNCRRPSSEVQPTTIVWDQEGSSDSYEGGLNFLHKDTRAAVAAGVHNRVLQTVASDPRWLQILKTKADCNDSPAASMFRAWYLSLLDVPAGTYSVGVCDTFTPLQDGMVDWLRRHPEAFGRTVAEYTKASSMFLWPDVKAMLSHILAVDCRLRFDTFVLTVHLKNEWIGGGASATKTGNKVAEGLDVLEKLATVHLELDRSPKTKGKEAPRVPSGIVKKERLVRFGATEDDDRPVLPPRVEPCSPDQIRKYIASPPDFSKLKAAEQLPDQSMSDEQKLLIQQEIARNNAEDSAARLAALEMARCGALQQQQPQPQQQPQQQQVAPVAQQAAKPVQPTQETLRPRPLSTPSQQREMLGLMRELFKTGAQAQEWMIEHANTNSPAELTDAEADGVISSLLKIKHELIRPNPPAPEQPQTQPQQQVAQPTQTAPPVTQAAPPVEIPGVDANGRATQIQRDRIRDLTIQVYGDKAAENQAGWLATMGFNSAGSLSYTQAAERIAAMERLACPKADSELPPF